MKRCTWVVAVGILALFCLGSTGVAFGQQKQVSLDLAMGGSDPDKDGGELWKIAVAFMKANPNVKINFVGKDHDAHRMAMKLAAQSNTLPDLFWEANTEWQAMQKLGAIMDLTAILKPIKGNLIDGALDNFSTPDGKIWGTGYMLSVAGVFYNKAVFDKAGLKIPTTWAELLNVVKVLKQKGITPFAQGTKDPWPLWSYCMYFERYGWMDFYPKFMAKQLKAVNDPGMLKAFGRIEELTKAGAYPENITTLDYAGMGEMFFSGKAAMYNTGTWGLKAIQDSPIAASVDFNFGPTFPDGIGPQKIGIKEIANGFFVGSKVAKDPAKLKAVTDLLKFMYSQDGAKTVMFDAKSLSIVKNNIDTSSNGNLFNLMTKKVQDEYKPVMQHYLYILPPELVSPFAQAWWDAVTGIMNGLYSPKEAAQKLDDWNATR